MAQCVEGARNQTWTFTPEHTLRADAANTGHPIACVQSVGAGVPVQLMPCSKQPQPEASQQWILGKETGGDGARLVTGSGGSCLCIRENVHIDPGVRI